MHRDKRLMDPISPNSVLTAHEQARWIAQQQIHRLSWQNTKQTKKKKNQDQSKGQNNRRQDQRADQGASKQSPPQKQKQTGKCYRCGRDHEPRTCPIRSWTCNKCNLVGHLAHMCKTKPQRVHQLETTAKEAPVNPPKAEVKSLRRTPNPSVDQEVDNMFASFGMLN
ncbi:Gag polyprotein [Frankliniella fusca]|uniref:Gag polyprotein n=1 Tax=Frankliniella fusca TaxID=407009 RepID=A0AAE1LTN7_9NEOP|nr:Gag polyprotein [Frankliniella fusca]